jgi:hypothetical protein
MSDDEAYRAMASGEVWAQFCDELKALGAEILRPTAPKAPVDLAEAHRFLTRMMRSAFELIVESGDAAVPALTVSLHETMKLGWDNPDNIHHNAYVSEAFEYRLSGRRGDAHTVTFAIYGGSYGKGEQGRDTVAFVDLDTLEIAPDGSFEARLSAREQPGNWIRLGPGSTTLMIRQTFWDRRIERPGEFRIERTDATAPPPPLDPATVAAALRRTTRYLRGSNKLFFDYSDSFFEKGVNRSRPAIRRHAPNQGIPFNQMSSAGWRIEEDEAAVIDFRPPPECPYWMFVLSNYWGESFDYRHHPIHTNARLATRRPDGSVRLVVAHRDPEARRTPSGSRRRAISTASGSSAGTSSTGSPPCPEPRIVKAADAREDPLAARTIRTPVPGQIPSPGCDPRLDPALEGPERRRRARPGRALDHDAAAVAPREEAADLPGANSRRAARQVARRVAVMGKEFEVDEAEGACARRGRPTSFSSRSKGG